MRAKLVCFHRSPGTPQINLTESFRFLQTSIHSKSDRQSGMNGIRRCQTELLGILYAHMPNYLTRLTRFFSWHKNRSMLLTLIRSTEQKWLRSFCYPLLSLSMAQPVVNQKCDTKQWLKEPLDLFMELQWNKQLFECSPSSVFAQRTKNLKEKFSIVHQIKKKLRLFWGEYR